VCFLEMAASLDKPNLLSSKREPVSASDLQMLEQSEALQALLAFSALHQQVRSTRSETPAAVNAGSDTDLFVLEEVLSLVAERARGVTGADGVAIALAEGNAIVCRGSAGTVCPDLGAQLNPQSDFSGACLRAGEVVRCDDTEHDSRVNLEACRRLGTRSMVAVPLCGKIRTIGLVQAFSRDAHAFNDSDVRSLQLLAELLLAALKPDDEKGASCRPSPASDVSGKQSLNWRPAPRPSQKAIEVREGLSPLIAEPIVFDKLESTDRGIPGLGVVASMVIVASLLAGGLWWKLRHGMEDAQDARPAIKEVVRQAKQLDATAAVNPSNANEEVEALDLSPPGDNSSARQEVSEDAQHLAVLPKITGVRHWSSSDASTVVIDLQDQVPYEAHRLASPERIYFDLHDTVLPDYLLGKSWQIGDPLLSRVRIAQPVAGVTRVVLDTAPGSNFSVSLEQNPYRLVVSLHGSNAGDQIAKTPSLFPDKADAAKKQLAMNVTAPTLPTLSNEEKQWRNRVPKIRVVVDAGHGGWDLGTVGRKGLLEKDLVLEIAQRLGKMLQSRLGSDVIYTRQDDNYLPLDQRSEVANEARADLFVSIHANYSDFPSARGVETYYTNLFVAPGSKEAEPDATVKKFLNILLSPDEMQEKRSESKKLALSVQKALFGTLSSQNPSIRNRGVKAASFVVLKGTTMPSILAEVSFVSSPSDEEKLRNAEYRQQIAEALYKGIARYAAASHKTSLASATPDSAGTR
jgi:N-acetylmuramoyl-L-alanine amidase